MLAIDDAKRIAAAWRPRFADEADFELSWTRYMESATVPDEHRLQAWLAKDVAISEVKHAGIVREPLVPEPSRYQPTDCPHCAGNGYVRIDVPVSDARFGKAFACPACNGGRRSDLVVPPSESVPARTGYWCWKCGADELAPAAEGCTNPSWHTPPGTPEQRATFDDVIRRF